MTSIYVPGQWNAICDRCGLQHKSGELREEWTGLMVCKPCWEPRHPQSLMLGSSRAENEGSAPPWVRPSPTDQFVDVPYIDPDDPFGLGSYLTELYWTASANDSLLATLPQGSYVGGTSHAVALPYSFGAKVVPRVGSSSDVNAPAAAFTPSPAIGNADKAVVGYGPVGTGPAIYFAGEGGTQSFNLPNQDTDHTGKSELRYSMFGTRLAVGSTIAVGTVHPSVSRQVAAGRINIISTVDGSTVASIAHARPVSSLAINADGVCALSNGIVYFYRSLDWTLQWSNIQPPGTGLVLFTNKEGTINCVNSAGMTYRLWQANWIPERQVYSPSTDLGSLSAFHFAANSEKFAAKRVTSTGANAPDLRWVWSGYGNDPNFFFKTQEEAILQYGSWWMTTFSVPDHGYRPSRNLSYTIDSVYPFGGFQFDAYPRYQGMDVTLHAERWYGYPEDLLNQPEGWYSTSTTATFYQFLYQNVPTTITDLQIWRNYRPTS